METKCKSCRKRGCIVKKSLKLQGKLAKWFKEEELSTAEGIMLLDDYIEETVPKLLKAGRKDRRLLRMVEGQRIYRDAAEDGTDFLPFEPYNEPQKEKDKSKKKANLWYIW